MLDYTDCIAALVADVVARVEPLRFIDPDRLLVFARVGRTGASGPNASCHCLNLPDSEPGYYYWWDEASRRITRRSECFVLRSPEVIVGGRRVDYLLSFSLPRFCDQRIAWSSKRRFYARGADWLAKLDTIVHELYHISPDGPGLRVLPASNGGPSERLHGPGFFEDVADMVQAYLASRPDPARYAFLRHDFAELQRRFGCVAGTTFRGFPSFPQRFADPVLAAGPAHASVPVIGIAASKRPRRYRDDDLEMREFLEAGARLVVAPRRRLAA